jgi:trehalose 6-phosphate synthase
VTDRIVVVANRLPLRRTDEGWETSPGGLVSAVAPFLRERGGSWVGWTGSADDGPLPFIHDGIEQRPVNLSQSDIDDFYLGFSNGTIWPLYHDAIRPPEFHRHWWHPYVAINRRFAEEAARALQPGDVAWVHDYQLQLVPAMLRRLRTDVRIGFFLHIPFPPVEILARLPWRREILTGLMGADVVAFQTRLGRHNFSRAVRRFLGGEGTTRWVRAGDRSVRLMSVPISIDTKRYASLAASPVVEARVGELREELGRERKVVLGVDRLDYTKGIDVRLRAFDTLLRRHKEDAEDVVFLQVAVPSRQAVDDYAAMRDQVEGLVGRINGAHGDLHHMPVHYRYGSLAPEDLVAYYRLADVMCVTPLRDGMNLVAKEYVASRSADNGVLVLSEFAGAALEFRQSLLVNPYDVDGVAETLWQALHLPDSEIRARMRALRRQVQRYDVFRWARTCLEAIRQ